MVLKNHWSEISILKVPEAPIKHLKQILASLIYSRFSFVPMSSVTVAYTTKLGQKTWSSITLIGLSYFLSTLRSLFSLPNLSYNLVII